MVNPKVLKSLYRWRVRGGTIGLAVVLIFARPAWKPLVAGLVINLFGLGLRTWAAGHLRKEKELTISGPYAYTRNPLYLGNLILGAGMVVGAWSWVVLTFLIVYFLIFYPVVIREERGRMMKLFPEAYEKYARSVPLFFPALKRAEAAQSHPFSWALYKKNKKLRAVIGTAVIWSLLIAKMLFISS